MYCCSFRKYRRIKCYEIVNNRGTIESTKNTIIMTNEESTNLNIHKDRPTSIASAIHGAHSNALGFNLDFIARIDPKLATELLLFYERAHKIRVGDSPAHEEDFNLFSEELKKLLNNTSEET